MTKRDFKLAIADAHSRLQQIRMPASAATRVRQNIDRTRGHRRTWTLFGLALATAASVMLAHAHLQRGNVARLPGGLETISSSSDLQLVIGAKDGTIEVRTGACTFRIPGWGSVALGPGSSLRPVDGGLELLIGTADFQVAKRAPGKGATFVRGPQGTIEITGTRFSVIQRRDDGSVRLDEGGIRFHAPDGSTVELVPGQSLTWPLPAPVLPIFPPAPPTSASEVPAGRIISGVRPAGVEGTPARSRFVPRVVKDAEPRGDDAMIGRIAVLRAKGQYRELADELEVAMLRERRPLTRERLSFELGSVLSYHLSDRTRACAHWADHRRRFPTGTYSEEVSDAGTFLHCSTRGEGK